MNVKGGTQTWSKAEQVSSLKTDASEKNMSAQDLQKTFGDGAQNVGDVLNKIADSNWVDPKKVRKVGNNQLDKDAFMKLMLTQMKYQDPTNPMQNHEMAAQLAQFSTLEQMSNINQTLEGMKAGMQPQTNYQALNFIGKKVAGDSSKLVRTNGDKFHDFNFELMNDASEVTVQVKDAEGNTIRTLKAQNQKKGNNSISWNGLNEDGAAARPGEYKFVIEAKSTQGTKVLAKTQFDGKITGMNFTAEGPVLMVGKQTVRLSDVKKIYEPTPEDMMMENAPAQKLEATDGAPGLKMMKPNAAATKPEDVPAASDDNDGPVSNLANGVGMSRDLINQLDKETKPSTGGSKS